VTGWHDFRVKKGWMSVRQRHNTLRAGFSLSRALFRKNVGHFPNTPIFFPPKTDNLCWSSLSILLISLPDWIHTTRTVTVLSSMLVALPLVCDIYLRRWHVFCNKGGRSYTYVKQLCSVTLDSLQAAQLNLCYSRVKVEESEWYSPRQPLCQ